MKKAIVIILLVVVVLVGAYIAIDKLDFLAPSQSTFFVYDDEEEWVTEEIMEIYSTISLAVLLILNNMTSDKIRKVLISYTGDYNALYSGNSNSYRFSMKAISTDYSRIIDVVEALKEEGIYVP